MDAQDSLLMGYVDTTTACRFSRRLNSWTKDLLWATIETDHVKLWKYSEQIRLWDRSGILVLLHRLPRQLLVATLGDRDGRTTYLNYCSFYHNLVFSGGNIQSLLFGAQGTFELLRSLGMHIYPLPPHFKSCLC